MVRTLNKCRNFPGDEGLGRNLCRRLTKIYVNACFLRLFQVTWFTSSVHINSFVHDFWGIKVYPSLPLDCEVQGALNFWLPFLPCNAG